MDLLDIGGGFPGSDDAELQFEEVWFIFIFFSYELLFALLYFRLDDWH